MDRKKYLVLNVNKIMNHNSINNKYNNSHNNNNPKIFMNLQALVEWNQKILNNLNNLSPTPTTTDHYIFNNLITITNHTEN